MNNSEKRHYWQQGGGNGNRNYINICLQFSVILNGPGYAGPLNDETIKILRKDGVSKKAIADRKRFCFAMKEGDIVVLKIGLKRVYAVGVIIGEYLWSDLFADVDGWDIRHVRRVKWLAFADKDDDGNFKTLREFDTNVIKQGTTLRLINTEVIQWIESLGLDFDQKYTVPNLPPDDPNCKLKIDDIKECFSVKGASESEIECMVSVIHELQKIAEWYKSNGHASEFETIGYLIIPLLKALGWTPANMAIEWNHVDIAFFNRVKRSNETLIAVLEAKKKDRSCLTAYSQACKYAKGKINCDRLIVTDGLRYGVFLKRGGKFMLHAYMNITDFRRYYLIYDCGGICEALWAMTPDWRI